MVSGSKIRKMHQEFLNRLGIPAKMAALGFPKSAVRNKPDSQPVLAMRR
jgi:hypothetical protein